MSLEQMDKQKRKKVLIINDPLQYGGSDLVAVRLQQHLDPDKYEGVYCLRHDEIGQWSLRWHSPACEYCISRIRRAPI